MTMIDVRIVNKGEGGPFPDVTQDAVTAFADCDRAVIMADGTAAGKTAVQFLGKTEDGRLIIIQTTAALLDTIQAASVGARRRWGEVA